MRMSSSKMPGFTSVIEESMYVMMFLWLDNFFCKKIELVFSECTVSVGYGCNYVIFWLWCYCTFAPTVSFSCAWEVSGFPMKGFCSKHLRSIP